MNTDPIADLLTRIRNAAKAGHGKVSIPHSKVKESILKVIKQRGFIEDYKSENDTRGHKSLLITINEEKRNLTLKRVSSPGQRIYVKNNELKPVMKGLGISIVSTSKGIMSNAEAKKMNLGGELICEIY